MRILTFAKTEKARQRQFERDTKNKDESFLWDNLDVGNRYNILLSQYYQRKHPSDLTQKQNYFKQKWDDLPFFVRHKISKYSLWAEWRSQVNQSIIFSGFGEALSEGLKQ